MSSSRQTGTAAWSGPLIWLLLTWPWVHPWAPGPEPNTVPLLMGWACLAALLALGRWPGARAWAQAWASAAVLSSLIGLLQYFGEAALMDGWAHVPRAVGEAMGNLRQRNQLATLTGIGAVALLWWHAQGLRVGVAGLGLTLLALGNAATGSRTGLLQWLMLPVLLGLWHACARSRRAPWSWPLLLWALAAYLLACLLLPQALSAWRGIDMPSALERMRDAGGCSSRSVLWANVLHLIAQKPWTGWGWGELKLAHYAAQYPGERFCEIMGNAHNLPLHLAFSFGLPVTLVLCALVLGLVLRARPWRVLRAQDSLGWGVLAVIGLHSLLEYPLWYSPFQLAMLAALGLLWPAGRAVLGGHRMRLQALGVAGLCLLTAVAFDYLRMRQIYLPAAQRVSVWRDAPWTAARRSWFFGDAVRFAEVTSTPVTPANAQAMLLASQAMLHYSPEPRVIDKLVQSARLAGQTDLAQWHQAQRRAVYGQTPD